MGVRLINYLVIGFSVCLTLGILSGYYTNNYLQKSFSPRVFFIFLGSLFILLIILWFFGKKTLRPFPLFGVVVYGSFLLIGHINYSLRLPVSVADHYIHFQEKEGNYPLQCKIKEVLKPDRFNTKYIAEIQAIKNTKASGKVLVYLQADSTFRPLNVDEIVMVSSRPKAIQPPKNPHQFNYAAYMKDQGVYGEIRLHKSHILTITKGTTTLKGFSEKIRNHLISKLQNSNLHTEERSILQALVLGQRTAIDKQLYNDYAAAGAIHILAVSGLHVGILYVILLFICKPITYLTNGNVIRSLLIVVLLWCFALLAGLSPSVVRAVTMFSFFTIAKAAQRPTNSFNTLFLSFFTLLLLQPNWLFHVGFQLSYLAVFFILWVQPKLYSLYCPKFYADRLFWSIITVTIAAQLGVVPLSLYYFHQFPGLFFVSNIVILPVLGLLLAGGILVVILAAFDALPHILAEGYNFTIKTLNTFIQWIANQHAFLFEEITFSGRKVVATYLVIITLTMLWNRFTSKRLILCLSSICVLLSVFLFEKKYQWHHELIVFHKSKTTLLAYKQNNKLTVFRNDTTIVDFPIKGYRIAKHISTQSEQYIPNLFQYNNTYILVIDSLGVYPKTSTIDIVLLTNSPKVNLERLIKELDPQQIIADGSNYTSYVDRWRRSCENKKLPFHHTGTKGAFTLK